MPHPNTRSKTGRKLTTAQLRRFIPYIREHLGPMFSANIYTARECAERQTFDPPIAHLEVTLGATSALVIWVTADREWYYESGNVLVVRPVPQITDVYFRTVMDWRALIRIGPQQWDAANPNNNESS